MLESSGVGPVWRPTLAPHPVKNLILEPVAILQVASEGWIEGDVKYYDSLTVDVVLLMRNMSSRPVKDVMVNASVLLGAAVVKTVLERAGEVPSNYEVQSTLEGLFIKAKDSPDAKALFDLINSQDSAKAPVVPVTVDADFVTMLGGPLDKVKVANARSVTRRLPLQSRSGSSSRLLEG